MDIQNFKQNALERRNVIIRRSLIIGGAIVAVAAATVIVLSQVQAAEDGEETILDEVAEAVQDAV